MYSVGIDLVEVARIEKAIQNKGFIEKYFSEKEIAEFEKKKFNPESVAGSFATKEAFLKSMQKGLGGFLLKEIEVLHYESGAPYLSFCGKTLEEIENKNFKFSVSITHTKDFAQAIVIAYK